MSCNLDAENVKLITFMHLCSYYQSTTLASAVLVISQCISPAAPKLATRDEHDKYILISVLFPTTAAGIIWSLDVANTREI